MTVHVAQGLSDWLGVNVCTVAAADVADTVVETVPDSAVLVPQHVHAIDHVPAERTTPPLVGGSVKVRVMAC